VLENIFIHDGDNEIWMSLQLVGADFQLLALDTVVCASVKEHNVWLTIEISVLKKFVSHSRYPQARTVASKEEARQPGLKHQQDLGKLHILALMRAIPHAAGRVELAADHVDRITCISKYITELFAVAIFRYRAEACSIGSTNGHDPQQLATVLLTRENRSGPIIWNGRMLDRR
jgi:hypothetical protein